MKKMVTTIKLKKRSRGKKLSEKPGHCERFENGDKPSKPPYNFENSGSSQQSFSVGLPSTEVGNNSAIMGLKNTEDKNNI